MISDLTTREHKIYDRLEDDLSRQVFLARKNAVKSYPLNLESYNFDAIPDFVALNQYKTQENIDDYIAKFATRTNKYIIYGAGGYGVMFTRKLMKINKQRFSDCVGVWDTNSLVEGKDTLGVGVAISIPPLKVNADEFSNIEIIITPTTPIIRHEIEDYLIKIGIICEQIYALGNNVRWECDYAAFEYFEYGSEEIFIDGGCLNFWSSIDFLERCPNAKKIYAFEPNSNVLDRIEKFIKQSKFGNVELINAGLWSENTTLSFLVNDNAPGGGAIDPTGTIKIDVVTLDSIVTDDENISFIKMDVEGAEIEALKGMRKTILQCKPKLAISIYHKAFDYIDIPEYILTLVSDYRIYFRHYTDFFGETVLFAIPQNK